MEIIEIVKSIFHERIQESIVEEIADDPVLLIQEQTAADQELSTKLAQSCSSQPSEWKARQNSRGIPCHPQDR